MPMFLSIHYYALHVDDRPVRDGERKAALMHFDSSQVCWLKKVDGGNLYIVLNSLPKI